MDRYEQSFLYKIDYGIKLNEQEMRELVYEWEYEKVELGSHRWVRGIKTIVKLGDRYFKIKWFEGLTENQENEYDEQPQEVYPNTYEKVITVTEWKLVKNKQGE